MYDAKSSLAALLVRDRLTFFSQWLRNPLRTASIAPSGQQLAQAMVAALPRDAERVIELGPGTGAITTALLARHPTPAHLLLVEMNDVLVRLLRTRFPDTSVACGDARHLDRIAAATPGFGATRVDAVVSSLGLLTMPQVLQADILGAAFRTLTPEGVFVQFTYGFAPPLARAVQCELGLDCRQVATAWLNLPPARVYVYRRSGRV